MNDIPLDVDAVARLRRVIIHLSRLLNASAAAEGLSPTQASILACVGHRGPVGIGELAEIEGVNPTMVSRIVGKLDGAGLVRRRPNPLDQRGTLVEATELGRELSDRVRVRRTETVTEILGSLPRAAADSLLAALPALEALAKGFERPRKEWIRPTRRAGSGEARPDGYRAG